MEVNDVKSTYGVMRLKFEIKKTGSFDSKFDEAKIV